MGKGKKEKKCGKEYHYQKKCKITLKYEKIYDDFYPDQTGAIYHQYAIPDNSYFVTYPFLEKEKEFKISIDCTTPGTQANPKSKVYGYNKDGSLNLNGGKKKSYNKDFENFHLKYHASKSSILYDPESTNSQIVQELKYLTPPVIKEYYDDIISYSTERGMDIQGADNFKKFKGTFLNIIGYGDFFSRIFIQPIWICEKKKKVPAYIDLVAYPFNLVLDVYQAYSNLRENGHAYPIRVPVTTDFCIFEKNKNINPIVFYDLNSLVITIHVPEKDYLFSKLFLDTGIPSLNRNREFYFLSFDASFSLLRRNKKNKLVASKIHKAEVLAQVSEFLSYKNKLVNLTTGANQIFEITIPIRTSFGGNPTIYYVGATVPLMNGGSSSYDNYIFPLPIVNAFINFEDPTQLPEEDKYAQGDNPVTTIVEEYSILSYIVLYDYQGFEGVGLNLPVNFLNVTDPFYCPETSSNVNTPIPKKASVKETMKNVSMHEFTHQMQISSGTLTILPAESMAVAIEMDTRISTEYFSMFRPRVFAKLLTYYTRGQISMMTPDTQLSSTDGLWYGMGLFWKYLQYQFDFNNQVMRRTIDILTNETFGPLLKDYNFPDSTRNGINSTGGTAAIKQSFSELFAKDFKEIWNDFSVSLVLLRNNSSIPKKYQSLYPYWIYNSEYIGYSVIKEQLDSRNNGQYANWWEKAEKNEVIPSTWNPIPYVGQTVIRTLPNNLPTTNIKNLTTLSFNVPHSVNNINIKVTRGEWRITLLQYTSDDTLAGTFKEFVVELKDTSYTFPVSTLGFNNIGNIRLVCCNLTFEGTGKTLNEYFSTEINTGSISITSD